MTSDWLSVCALRIALVGVSQKLSSARPALLRSWSSRMRLVAAEDAAAMCAGFEARCSSSWRRLSSSSGVRAQPAPVLVSASDHAAPVTVAIPNPAHRNSTLRVVAASMRSGFGFQRSRAMVASSSKKRCQLLWGSPSCRVMPSFSRPPSSSSTCGQVPRSSSKSRPCLGGSKVKTSRRASGREETVLAAVRRAESESIHGQRAPP